jgi:hypothetical protein
LLFSHLKFIIKNSLENEFGFIAFGALDDVCIFSRVGIWKPFHPMSLFPSQPQLLKKNINAISSGDLEAMDECMIFEREGHIRV